MDYRLTGAQVESLRAQVVASAERMVSRGEPTLD